MIAILGALVGLIPHLFKFGQDYTDKKQELEILKIQAELMKANVQQKMQEVAIDAQAAQVTAAYSSISKINIKFVEAVNGLIRPMIAIIYTSRMVLGFFCPDNIELLDHDYGIYSCIIAFYFGDFLKR